MFITHLRKQQAMSFHEGWSTIWKNQNFRTAQFYR